MTFSRCYGYSEHVRFRHGNALDEIVSGFQDKTLNDVPEFAGLNPSIEHFCRIVYTALSQRLTASNVRALAVTIWENETAWAAFRQVLS